jgi:hypothetical protein
MSIIVSIVRSCFVTGQDFYKSVTLSPEDYRAWRCRELYNSDVMRIYKPVTPPKVRIG